MRVGRALGQGNLWRAGRWEPGRVGGRAELTQRRISWLRTELVLSNPRLLQLGGEQHSLPLPNPFFLARWEGEGRQVPASLVALGAAMVAEKQVLFEK